jgi:aryl-alcohol dehydrogenase-like predicted oxidoreductase
MRIAIGSAQFGKNYGLSNTYGQSDKDEVKKILQYAIDNGVALIDTAPSYGQAEDVLGEVINKIKFKIITKTPVFAQTVLNKSHAESLRQSFFQSQLKLKQKEIYGLLVHSCDDLLRPGGELLFKEMEHLKSIGLINKIGVSVYNSDQIELVLTKYNIDIIQLPINIFDQKLFLEGWLKKLKDKNIEIHARSIFLQGLLLMQSETIPEYFLPIKDKIIMFSKSAHDLSLSKLELALSFVAGICEIDKIVVGVNTLKQFQEIINASKIETNPSDFIDQSIENPIYTNPSLWKI